MRTKLANLCYLKKTDTVSDTSNHLVLPSQHMSMESPRTRRRYWQHLSHRVTEQVHPNQGL